MQTRRRNGTHDDVSPLSRGNRPVLLATMEVPFDDEAAAFAVDAAVESGQRLIVANVVEIPLGPICVTMGYGTSTRPSKTQHDSVRRPSLRTPSASRSSGFACAARTRSTRCSTSWPSSSPGLLVFGPDRDRLKPRTFRKVAKKIRQRVTCLIWLAD